jgi:hypothetical protein
MWKWLTKSRSDNSHAKKSMPLNKLGGQSSNMAPDGFLLKTVI